MIRVNDFDAAMRFYVNGLGMKQMDEPFHVETRRATGVFLGFEDYAAGGCVELVQNWDAVGPYSHGTIAIRVCSSMGIMSLRRHAGRAEQEWPT
jgi:lactoylglutathione lyase